MIIRTFRVVAFAAFMLLPVSVSASELPRHRVRGDLTIGSNAPSTETAPNLTRTVMFSIYWSGLTTEIEEVSWYIACSGAVTCTTVQDSDMMSKNNPTIDIYVTYTTGASGNGSVYIEAVGNTDFVTDEVIVAIPGAFSISPEYDEMSVLKTSQAGGTGAAIFAVSNSTSISAAYQLSCTYSGASSSCPDSVWVGGNSSTEVSMGFSGVADEADITLSVTSAGTTRSGTYHVTALEPIVNPGNIAVALIGATTIRLPSNYPGSAQFRLANSGGTDTYTLSCSLPGCSVSPSSAQITGGDSINATVSFSAGAPGSKTLALTASGNSNSDNASVQIRSGGSVATITGPASFTAPENYGWNIINLGMTNSGDGTDVYNVTCTRSGAVTGCYSYFEPVDLPYGGSATFSIRIASGASGSGSVTITTTSPSNSASFTVPVNVTAAGQVAVTPDNQSQSMNTNLSQGTVVPFTVTNTGGSPLTNIGISAACAPYQTVPLCTYVTTSIATLAAGASETIDVRVYTGSTPGVASVKLIATSVNTDTGSYNVTVSNPGGSIAVTALGASPVRVPANSGPFSAKFKLTNTGLSDTYNLTCSGCTPAVDSLTLTAGQSDTVDVTFSSGSPGLTQVTLTALSPTSGNTNTGSFQVQSGGAVATMTAASPLSAHTGSVNNPASITMTNTGAGTNNYVITCSPAGAVTACTPPAAAVALPYNGTATFNVPYNVGTGASGTFTVTATAPGNTASIIITVNTTTPPPQGVIAVSPDLATDTILRNTTGASVAFNVQNTGSVALSNISLAVGCTPSTRITSCASSTSTIASLAAGASQPVSVTFNTTSTNGLGTITLTASGANTDSGSYSLRMVASLAGPPEMALDTIKRLDRSDCVTTGAGPEGAFQCGELLLAHAMPAFKTMNEDRRLTLLYNSGPASMQKVLVARVRLGATTAVPDEVQLTLHIGGQLWTYRFAGSSFARNRTRRVSLLFDASAISTGLYAYDVQATNYYAGAPIAGTPVHGEIVVVNRKKPETSPYGVGWSVAGHNQLYVGQSGREALLMVEADASYTVYDSIAPNVFLAGLGAFRDTVMLGSFDPGTGQNGTYYRQQDKDGTASYYDMDGRLRWVKDRRGQRVEFTYREAGPVSPLKKIYVAPRELDAAYTFEYANDKLDYVTDPAGRTLNVSVNTNGTLTSFQDPGLASPVILGYNAAPGLVTSWRSPRGYTFGYVYHPETAFLTTVAMPNGGVIGINPAELRGIAAANGTVASAAGDTGTVVITGPRADQTVVFHTTEWGSASKFIDALGNTTTITRGKWQYPQMPTLIVMPNGARRILTYDNVRGNLKAVRDSTLGIPNLPNGLPTTVTEYTYGSGNNRTVPTKVLRRGDTYDDSTTFTINSLGLIATAKAPNGRVTTFTYDQTLPFKGSMVSIQENPVTTYDPVTKTKAPAVLTSSFTYDALGNVKTQTNPAGFTRTFYKDALGRDTAFTNEVLNRSSFGYNAYNQLQWSISHPGVADSAGTQLLTSYAYDHNTLLSVTDPRMVPVRTFTRDAFDRVTGEMDDYGKTDVTVYDSAGNVVKSIPRTFLGSTASIPMRYDAAGQLKAKSWPQREFSDGDSVLYHYDNMGRDTLTKTSLGSVRREYWANGLLKTEVQSNKPIPSAPPIISTHHYEYDSFGRRTAYHMGDAEQDHIFYRYAPGDRSMTIKVQWRNTTTLDSVVLRMDELGRRDSALFFVTDQQPTRVGYGYDKAGVLRSICSRHPDTVYGTFNDLLNFRWSADSVDAAGRATYVSAGANSSCPGSPELAFSRWNKFDGHGRLRTQKTQERIEYRYDGSGNLITKVQILPSDTVLRRFEFTIPDGHNRLGYFTTRYRSRIKKEFAVAYDSSGNRLEEIPSGMFADSAYFQQRGYYYDGLGRMTGSRHFELKTDSSVIELFHTAHQFIQKKFFADYWWNSVDVIWVTTATPINLETACKYDAVGRMWDPCDNGAPALSFDGNNVVRTGDDRLDASKRVFSFVHGPGLDDPLLARKVNEGVLIYITNGQGEVFSIANANGSDTRTRLFSDNPALAGGIRNAGSFDNQSPGATGVGLSYYRNRFYDTETGRWTQEDPIGIAGGVNLYAYAGNDPSSYSDPFGLEPCLPACGVRQYLGNYFQGAWNMATEHAKAIAGRFSAYAIGNVGMLAGRVDRDFAGRNAVRTGGELSTDALSAGVGLEMAIQTAPNNSVALNGQIPIGLKTSQGGAGASITLQGAIGPDGKLYLTSAGLHFGTNVPKFGKEGVGGSLAPPAHTCRGTGCR